MESPIDMTYNEPEATPARLTDSAEEYAAPSEAAYDVARQIFADWVDCGRYGEFLEYDLPAIANLIEQYAQQAVAARDAEIIAALQQQIIPPPHTPRMERYNSVLHDAIGIIQKL